MSDWRTKSIVSSAFGNIASSGRKRFWNDLFTANISKEMFHEVNEMCLITAKSLAFSLFWFLAFDYDVCCYNCQCHNRAVATPLL